MEERTEAELTDTREDLLLAQQLYKLAEEIGVEETALFLDTKYAAEMAEEHQNLRRDRREKKYQELLAAVDGDFEVLSRFFYSALLDSYAEKGGTTPRPDKCRSGRKPNKWGADGAGKIMLFVIVEEELKKMRVEGIKRPKINDAIARCLNITTERRIRSSSVRAIRDYASRYSEAKKILKHSKYPPTFLEL